MVQSSPVRPFHRFALVFAWACSLGAPAIASEPEPIRFNANFEGGSLGRVERLGATSFRVHVRGQQDEHGRNRQASWYNFRLDGVRGLEIALTLTDFVGEYDGKPGACPMGPDILPVLSDDGEHWRDADDVTWDDDAKEAALRLRPGSDSIWIAHRPPYTTQRLARLLEEVDRSPDARVETIGKSARGRDLLLITVTDTDAPDAGKVTVWLQARQHAWEADTSFVMEGALRFITSDDPHARSLRRGAVFLFTPMVDPDGCAGGGVRFNANGYDLNRHWDEVDLRSKRDLARMPEIWYVKKAVLAHLGRGGRIDLMLNLHNTETAEYLQTAADDGTSRAIVGRLSDRLVQEAGVRPSRGPTLGAAPDGTASALHAEAGVLILLMEQRIARDPRTGRTPTPEERLEFGAKLLGIMAESVGP